MLKSRIPLTVKIAVFWVVAPCSLVEVYQRFRGPCCLHHPPSSSHPTTLHGATTQKTAIFILTAVRTSNPRNYSLLYNFIMCSCLFKTKRESKYYLLYQVSYMVRHTFMHVCLLVHTDFASVIKRK
jgi:hypothetical protein